MVSLLEKVWLHRSSHRFGPELEMQEINQSHWSSVSTWVKVSLTSNCSLPPKVHSWWEMRLSINLEMERPEGNREHSLVWLTTHIHIHRRGDLMGSPCSGFVSWCVTGSLHRQQWETPSASSTPKTTGPRYYRQKGTHRNTYRSIENKTLA